MWQSMWLSCGYHMATMWHHLGWSRVVTWADYVAVTWPSCGHHVGPCDIMWCHVATWYSHVGHVTHMMAMWHHKGWSRGRHMAITCLSRGATWYHMATWYPCEGHVISHDIMFSFAGSPKLIWSAVKWHIGNFFILDFIFHLPITVPVEEVMQIAPPNRLIDAEDYDHMMGSPPEGQDTRIAVELCYASVYTCVCVLVYAICVCTLRPNKPVIYWPLAYPCVPAWSYRHVALSAIVLYCLRLIAIFFAYFTV